MNLIFCHYHEDCYEQYFWKIFSIPIFLQDKLGARFFIYRFWSSYMKRVYGRKNMSIQNYKGHFPYKKCKGYFPSEIQRKDYVQSKNVDAIMKCYSENCSGMSLF